MPLGVMPGGYDEAVVDIEPGSTLVLYTDGLVEERGEPIDDGLERLRQAVIDGPGRSRGAVRPRASRRWAAPDRAADDVALFVLRTVPVAVRGADARAVDPAAVARRRCAARWAAGSTHAGASRRGVAGHPDGGARGGLQLDGARLRVRGGDVQARRDAQRRRGVDRRLATPAAGASRASPTAAAAST